ncbi:MAG TPA: palindromic element RPE4 domain-containing protein [Rickettsia endosymbiont of Bembidion lapponicum]|nr:palindromic element RPE4 domain-containing protein [Rickettsia endosymbiont of Bembidion lapponicum]
MLSRGLSTGSRKTIKNITYFFLDPVNKSRGDNHTLALTSV